MKSVLFALLFSRLFKGVVFVFAFYTENKQYSIILLFRLNLLPFKTAVPYFFP